MASEFEQLDPTGREVLRGLLRGATPEDLAWASGRSADDVLTLAHDAVSALAGETGLDDRDRRYIVEYLLQRQSPGQAAGTWELMERSQPARRWAGSARAGLEALYAGEPPALPGGEGRDGPPPQQWVDPAGEQAATLADRRAERSRGRRAAALRAAVAYEMSPFRREAIESHSAGQERVVLPHYASRPTRVALNLLALALIAALVFCALVEVPAYVEAKVLVTSLDADAPGPQQGIAVIALFSPDTLDDLEPGRTLRVQLPETEERVGMRLSHVEAEVLSPRQIIDRYGVPDPQSRRVRDPSVVAVAGLRVASAMPPRESFEGVVTDEADLRVGSRRILSLLF